MDALVHPFNCIVHHLQLLRRVNLLSLSHSHSLFHSFYMNASSLLVSVTASSPSDQSIGQHIQVGFCLWREKERARDEKTGRKEDERERKRICWCVQRAGRMIRTSSPKQPRVTNTAWSDHVPLSALVRAKCKATLNTRRSTLDTHQWLGTHKQSNKWNAWSEQIEETCQSISISLSFILSGKISRQTYFPPG